MRSKQVYLTLTILGLLISCFFVQPALSDDPTPEPTPIPQTLAVSLISPNNETKVTNSFNVSFTFKPTLSGSDNIEGADLFINGSKVGENQTAIANNQNNIIYYAFTSNGTSTWTVKVRNSTNVITADLFSITMEVHVVDPTPTPSPSPSPSPTPTVTPTPTPVPPTYKPTATPTPTPEPEPALDTWTVVIIAVIAIIAVGAIVVLVLGRKK
jgi:hypothetical protein